MNGEMAEEMNDEMAEKMSGEELFNESSLHEDSDIESVTPLTYKEFVSASKGGHLSGRRRIVLQTSCVLTTTILLRETSRSVRLMLA